MKPIEIPEKNEDLYLEYVDHAANTTWSINGPRPGMPPRGGYFLAQTDTRSYDHPDRKTQQTNFFNTLNEMMNALPEHLHSAEWVKHSII